MTTKKVIVIALMAFVTGFFLAAKIGCNGPDNIVLVPEIGGSITATEPVKHDEPIKYLPSKVIKSTEDSLDLMAAQEVIARVNNQYKSLADDYDCLSDSLKRAKYREVVKPKSFSQPFEDSLFSGTITGIVFNGEVQNGTRFDYMLKERKIKQKQKELLLRVLAGGEVGINKELNQGIWKANLSVQDAKNNLYTGSFQKIGGQEYWLAGFQKSIFSINKKEKKNVEQKR
jgi:hypothetical protein